MFSCFLLVRFMSVPGWGTGLIHLQAYRTCKKSRLLSTSWNLDYLRWYKTEIPSGPNILRYYYGQLVFQNMMDQTKLKKANSHYVITRMKLFPDKTTPPWPTQTTYIFNCSICSLAQMLDIFHLVQKYLPVHDKWKLIRFPFGHRVQSMVSS